jgi:hypothetical protein
VTVVPGATAGFFTFTTDTSLKGWALVVASLGMVKKSAAFTLTTPGSLTVSFDQPAKTVVLPDEGTADWAHWGLNSAADFDHKENGSGQIGNFTVWGGGTANRYANNPVLYTWTGGTPNAAATDSAPGVYVAGQGKGFNLIIPAGKTPMTLRLYVGVWSGQSKLVAHVSDGSVADYVDTSLTSATYRTSVGVYTLVFHAASEGQVLSVTFTQESAAGNVTLQAATLSY